MGAHNRTGVGELKYTKFQVASIKSKTVVISRRPEGPISELLSFSIWKFSLSMYKWWHKSIDCGNFVIPYMKILWIDFTAMQSTVFPSKLLHFINIDTFSSYALLGIRLFDLSLRKFTRKLITASRKLTMRLIWLGILPKFLWWSESIPTNKHFPEWMWKCKMNDVNSRRKCESCCIP